VELLLGCYQVNEAVIEERYPADSSTLVELGSLLAQIDWGNASDFEVWNRTSSLQPNHSSRMFQAWFRSSFSALCHMFCALSSMWLL
jgi:hypothetical protein